MTNPEHWAVRETQIKIPPFSSPISLADYSINPGESVVPPIPGQIRGSPKNEGKIRFLTL